MSNVPNLDCMDLPDLLKFWQKYCYPKKADAAELFPGRPTLYTTIAWELAEYAFNIRHAKVTRASGAIQTALEYEARAQRIYDKLPAWARW